MELWIFRGYSARSCGDPMTAKEIASPQRQVGERSEVVPSLLPPMGTAVNVGGGASEVIDLEGERRPQLHPL